MILFCPPRCTQSFVFAVGIPDDPRLAETFYEQDEFSSESDGDEDVQSMCSNLQSVLFDATCAYYLVTSLYYIVMITFCPIFQELRTFLYRYSFVSCRVDSDLSLPCTECVILKTVS